jgi:hypothetical protein
MEHLRFALQRLTGEGLKLRLNKCFFGLHEMKHLSYNVSGGKSFVSARKVNAVKYWHVLTTQWESRRFVHVLLRQVHPSF